METKPQIKEVPITDQVLAKIEKFRETGQLDIPRDYSPANALKSAWLLLQDVQTRDKKPVLEACSKTSIANALFEMVVSGLNPMKHQCAFVAYGNHLEMQRQYQGTIALAKRYGNVTSVIANIIFDKDEFVYEVDPKTGKKRLIKHDQKIEHIDETKIKGAYAIVSFADAEPHLEIMTKKQIDVAWSMGATNGNSPAHKNFPGEMAKKTVINRACKLFIEGSDDESVVAEDKIVNASQAEVIEKQAIEEVTFEEVPEPKQDEPKGEPKNEAKDEPKEPEKPKGKKVAQATIDVPF